MAKLYNLARMTTATTGTGTITLAVAVAGYLTFATAGVANAEVVTYAIKDGANSEIGTGTYTSAGLTLTRTVIKSTNADAAISLSGSAEVFITPSTRDYFDQGTAVLFQQTAAPSGWTKQTTHNDKALRVVSGTASSGGTNAFSTVMAQTTVGATTLTSSQIPSHTHTYDKPVIGAGNNKGDIINGNVDVVDTITAGSASGSAGTGGSHNHTITMAMQYVDVIIATKD